MLEQENVERNTWKVELFTGEKIAIKHRNLQHLKTLEDVPLPLPEEEPEEEEMRPALALQDGA